MWMKIGSMSFFIPNNHFSRISNLQQCQLPCEKVKRLKRIQTSHL